MKFEEFEVDEKRRLVNILNHEVVIDGKVQYVNNAVKIYCKSVFDALRTHDANQIRFIEYEL